MALLLFVAPAAQAATYYWTTWNSYNFDGTTYTLTGTITTGGGATVTVTYTNTQGLPGYQLSGGTGGTTNYYSGGTDGASGTSPCTSATVANRPNNVTIIRLSNAGAQTLTFQFVKDEFDAFLECGILAHGFLRLRCRDCGHDKLVAFSCKRRGFCPSCGARRMAQTAAHRVDRVSP